MKRQMAGSDPAVQVARGTPCVSSPKQLLSPSRVNIHAASAVQEYTP